MASELFIKKTAALRLPFHSRTQSVRQQGDNLKKNDPEVSIAANALGRKLNVSAERLFNEYGLRFANMKTHEGRLIRLTRLPAKAEAKENLE